MNLIRVNITSSIGNPVKVINYSFYNLLVIKLPNIISTSMRLVVHYICKCKYKNHHSHVEYT